MATSTAHKTESQPEVKKAPKDRWDKADIILKTIGALLTALTVAAVGFFGSRYLAQKQDAESDARLYSELMTKREESDSSLRKDMFNYIITNILKPEPASLDQKVLNLELLASNFHETLDLAPLFRDVRQQIVASPTLPKGHADRLVGRLEKVTQEIIDKQISSLAEAGGKIDGTIDLDELAHTPQGVPVIETQPIAADYREETGEGGAQKKTVFIEALKADTEKKEILLRLEVRSPLRADADVTLRVGLYNFPMLNNIRLSEGQRCAVVLRSYDESSAEITFVYFPGSRASLKEKLYYDEVLNLLKAKNQAPTSQEKN